MPTSVASKAVKSSREALISNPGAFKTDSEEALAKWDQVHDPAVLRQAGRAILEFYRWWLWNALGRIDPITRDEDNLRTSAIRLRNRLAFHDSKGAERLYELADEAYWLRNRLDHGRPDAPDEGRVRNLVEAAAEFEGLVQQAVERLMLPEPADWASYLEEQFGRIDLHVTLMRGHYPDQRVEGLAKEAMALQRVMNGPLPHAAMEPFMILLREYQNALDVLSSEMYTTCPRCGGKMVERTSYLGSGGTEANPEPTSSTGFWSILCEQCGHVVESETFDAG